LWQLPYRIKIAWQHRLVEIHRHDRR
jgi:hypothetical protein